MMPVSHFSTPTGVVKLTGLLLSTGGFKSPGRGRGEGGSVRGRKVIIEAYEGDYVIHVQCVIMNMWVNAHTHTHHYRGMLCRKFWDSIT